MVRCSTSCSARQPSHPTVKVLHSEVYADPFTTLEKYSPTLLALGLQFEPCLVLAGADGKVVQRLDSIFDEDG